MILTAHQPVYLPWLGLFHKISMADMFCFFDIAQYQKKDFNNRNKIRDKNQDFWLSVPVKSANHFSKTVGNIEIIQDGWQSNHLKSITLSYKKTPFFNEYFPELEKIIINDSQDSLGNLNLSLLRYFMKCLNINTPVVLASDYNFQGRKSDLVLDMCLQLDADQYVFGKEGRNYADINKFSIHGVKVYFQEYNHPIYRQTSKNFMPYMSIIDLLFNKGPKSLDILMSDNSLKSEIFV